MAQQITVAGMEGTLEVNEDGELVHVKSALETEVLKPEDAIRRWPAAETQIRQALAQLD